jgi:hypothetical protein
MGDTAPADDYKFFYGNVNENNQLGLGFFVHNRIISGGKKMEFVSERISCTV